MERHTVVSLWAEAALHGHGNFVYGIPAERWNDDSWAWFIAHVIPWTAERKFANTAILDKEAEQRYWAGPWEQRQRVPVYGLVKKAGKPFEPEKWWMRVMGQHDQIRRKGWKVASTFFHTVAEG